MSSLWYTDSFCGILLVSCWFALHLKISTLMYTRRTFHHSSTEFYNSITHPTSKFWCFSKIRRVIKDLRIVPISFIIKHYDSVRKCQWARKPSNSLLITQFSCLRKECCVVRCHWVLETCKGLENAMWNQWELHVLLKRHMKTRCETQSILKYY